MSSASVSSREERAHSEGVPPVRIVEITPDGWWRVRLPGSRRASAVLDTRQDAEARAREILRRSGGGELRVHLKSGEVWTSTVSADTPLPGRRQLTRHPRGSRW